MAAMEFPTDIWDKIISFLGHERHLEPLSLVSKTLLSITNHHKKTLKITIPTSKSLPSLLRRFPNLKHLDFSEFSGDPIEVMKQIAGDGGGIRIETLDVSNNECFPIEELPPSIFNCLKSFKAPPIRLRLSEIGYIAKIVKSFPDLEELDFSESKSQRRRGFNYSGYHHYDSDDDRFYVTLDSIKCLRRINLSDNDWLTDDFLASIVINCPDLEEISLRNCGSVTSVGIRVSLHESNNLKKIRFGDGESLNYWSESIHIDHEDLHWPKNLSEIDMFRIEVSYDLISSIVKADLPLKRVTLERFQGFTYEGMIMFFNWYDDLDYLALVEVDFLEDSLILALCENFKRLRHVKLTMCRNLSDSSFLTLIKKCPLLEEVEMVETGLGKWSFEENDDVVVNRRIRRLKLSKNDTLSDESMKKTVVATCPNLESLKLDSCDLISSKGVGEVMRSCRYLKDLHIRGCSKMKGLEITDDSLLESLDASESSLDDRGLIEIANKCKNLMFVKLSKCAYLTSKGVTELVTKCTKLKEIDLNECRFMSNKLLAWMISIRPSLRRIVPPHEVSDLDVNLYLRHGCYVESYMI